MHGVIARKRIATKEELKKSLRENAMMLFFWPCDVRWVYGS